MKARIECSHCRGSGHEIIQTNDVVYIRDDEQIKRIGRVIEYDKELFIKWMDGSVILLDLLLNDLALSNEPLFKV